MNAGPPLCLQAERGAFLRLRSAGAVSAEEPDGAMLLVEGNAVGAALLHAGGQAVEISELRYLAERLLDAGVQSLFRFGVLEFKHKAAPADRIGNDKVRPAVAAFTVAGHLKRGADKQYSLIGKYSLTGVTAAMGDSGIIAPRGGLTPLLGGALPGASRGNRGYALLQGTELHKLDRDWGDGFWAGLVGQFDLTSALRLGVEGSFGSVYMGEIKDYQGFGDRGRTLQMKRQGWYAGARLDYHADWGVPGFIAWYGSGDDDNPYNGSERLPQFNTPWAVSSLGFGDPGFDEQTWKLLGHNPGGSAGFIAQIDKISFISDLTHLIRVGLYLGTNSCDMPKRIGMNWPSPATDGPMGYLTTTDNAWEVNLVNTWKIDDNLTFQLEGAYVRLNLDSDTWQGRQDAIYKDNYRVSCMFKYSF